MFAFTKQFTRKLFSRNRYNQKLLEHSAVTKPAEKAVPDPMVEPDVQPPVDSVDSLGVISGVPERHLKRRVKIYRPPRTATQQGRGSKYAVWKLEFEKLEEGDRWTNPLMGWTSTGDPLSQTAVYFPDRDSAIEYAKRYGLSYIVFEPEEEEEHIRSFNAYGKSMVHQWNHSGVPKYEDEE
ncbi:hypothetical protein GpartN1_g3599.t1 [Galdieria partita]|uniref:NADH dehydrogenase [ubiquinone] iron-sulfur protein 4, mitochondrial n=1 Tax=Galdieria partita TaxID=83374 RepID=A0A9C7PW01_9RHOD|nr:hypothetical protein GpartN1_g3599.t1 [Galdieria partita]